MRMHYIYIYVCLYIFVYFTIFTVFLCMALLWIVLFVLGCLDRGLGLQVLTYGNQEGLTLGEGDVLVGAPPSHHQPRCFAASTFATSCRTAVQH